MMWALRKHSLSMELCMYLLRFSSSFNGMLVPLISFKVRLVRSTPESSLTVYGLVHHGHSRQVATARVREAYFPRSLVTLGGLDGKSTRLYAMQAQHWGRRQCYVDTPGPSKEVIC